MQYLVIEYCFSCLAVDEIRNAAGAMTSSENSLSELSLSSFKAHSVLQRTPLTRIMLLALCLWVLAFTASSAEDDGPGVLNQQAHHLIEQGKYQEALPIAEKAVVVAKRARGPEHLDTADALNNLGLLFKKTGDYTKAEPLLQE